MGLRIKPSIVVRQSRIWVGELPETAVRGGCRWRIGRTPLLAGKGWDTLPAVGHRPRPSAQSGNRGRQPTVPPTVGGGANLTGHPLVELPPDNDHPPRGAHPEDDPIPLHPEEPDLHL